MIQFTIEGLHLAMKWRLTTFSYVGGDFLESGVGVLTVKQDVDAREVEQHGEVTNENKVGGPASRPTAGSARVQVGGVDHPDYE